MTLFTLFFCNFHFNQLKFLHTNDTMNLNKESYYMNNKEISIFTVAEKAGVQIPAKRCTHSEINSAAIPM